MTKQFILIVLFISVTASADLFSAREKSFCSTITTVSGLVCSTNFKWGCEEYPVCQGEGACGLMQRDSGDWCTIKSSWGCADYVPCSAN